MGGHRQGLYHWVLLRLRTRVLRLLRFGLQAVPIFQFVAVLPAFQLCCCSHAV